MRIAPVALACSALVVPAAVNAQERRPDAEQAVRAMQDPLAQELAAGAIDQLVGIVLDTRVGPLGALTDSTLRPGDTLRDVKRRDDPDFERNLRQDTRRAVGTAAAAAGGAMAQAGEIRRTADRLQAALGPLIAAVSGPRSDY